MSYYDDIIGSLTMVWLFTAIACSAFCSSHAAEKNRSTMAWAIGGLLFGFIALISIAGLPARPAKQVAKADLPPNWPTDKHAYE